MKVVGLRGRFNASAAWYDGVYAAPAPEYLWHHEKQQRLRWTVRLVQEELARGTRTVLDVGCGNGELACRLGQVLPGVRIRGIDIAPAMIARAVAKARSRGLADRLLFRVAALEEDEGTYDGVTALGVVGYQPDPLRFLSALGARVRPGGWLAVSLGNAASGLRRLREGILGAARHLGLGPSDRVFRGVAVGRAVRLFTGEGWSLVACRPMAYGLGWRRLRFEGAISRWIEARWDGRRLGHRIFARCVAQSYLVVLRRPQD